MNSMKASSTDEFTFGRSVSTSRLDRPLAVRMTTRPYRQQNTSTFPAGPILYAIAQQREYHTTPCTVSGVPANGGAEQVGLAGRHDHEYDHRNGMWVCWICDHTVRNWPPPPVEATELAE